MVAMKTTHFTMAGLSLSGNVEANLWSEKLRRTSARFHNTTQEGYGTELPISQSDEFKSGLAALVLHGFGCARLMMMMIIIIIIIITFTVWLGTTIATIFSVCGILRVKVNIMLCHCQSKYHVMSLSK